MLQSCSEVSVLWWGLKNIPKKTSPSVRKYQLNTCRVVLLHAVCSFELMLIVKNLVFRGETCIFSIFYNVFATLRLIQMQIVISIRLGCVRSPRQLASSTKNKC